jgi:hypothetical protein
MRPTRPSLPVALLAAALLLFAPAAHAQKKPKKAMKESDARRAIAATPGFTLNSGAVRVREVSDAGATPVVVRAEVEVALGFTKAEGAKGGPARWRADEFRTGDRRWEEFDYFVGLAAPGAVEGARAALEEMAAEFESKRRERGKGGESEDARGDGRGASAGDEVKGDEKKASGEEKNAGGEDEKIEVRRGPVLMKEFAPIYKSARAVVTVEASFRLERLAGGRWQVVGFEVGGIELGGLAELIAAADRRKAERARADLKAVSRALEEFRRERGSYVVSDSEVVLIDHLSPVYLKSVIRIDPWRRPYRYSGTRDRFTLSSDGPDGQPSTADDVSIAR